MAVINETKSLMIIMCNNHVACAFLNFHANTH